MPTTILAINPGSTSTKIGVYEDYKELFTENIALSLEEIASFPRVMEQYQYRHDQIETALKKRGFALSRLTAVVGRGGLTRPLESGIYTISEAMKRDLRACGTGEHACNLGPLLADAIAGELGVPSFVADPGVVDELDDVVRVTGHKLFKRITIFHCLNQKAVARRWCKEQGRSYEESSVIVAHMGGGVSVGYHRNGRVADVNNAFNGEGPFSAERSGTLPAADLAKLCFSGKYAEKEVLKMISGQGGLVSLQGTNDMRVVLKRAHEGDKEADLAFRAFAYGIGKAIGALAAAARGRVDGILLTGGIAYSQEVTDAIREMVDFIAPVFVYPGEGEIEALAIAGFRALAGEAEIKTYE